MMAPDSRWLRPQDEAADAVSADSERRPAIGVPWRQGVTIPCLGMMDIQPQKGTVEMSQKYVFKQGAHEGVGRQR